MKKMLSSVLVWFVIAVIQCGSSVSEIGKFF
jgi:hypothetical protein